jgi:LPS sulfotransferase NodH
MERIIIACTPRTGSTLLQCSLAAHPKAISGGEWFEYAEYRNEKNVWDNKIHRPTLCNLLKVFSYNQEQPKFNKVLHSGKVIYLYRKSTKDQILSWQKACELGMWRADQDKPEVTTFPSNALDRIQQAKELFTPIADLVISYEYLIDHWEESIRHILQISNWPIIPISMSIEKQL